MKKLLLSLCAVLLPACASISQTFIYPVNSDFERNPIYAGVRFDSGIIKAGYFSLTEAPRCAGTDGKLACYSFLPAIIDWPLSLAFDTLFLPYSIPKYFINY